MKSNLKKSVKDIETILQDNARHKHEDVEETGLKEHKISQTDFDGKEISTLKDKVQLYQFYVKYLEYLLSASSF